MLVGVQMDTLLLASKLSIPYARPGLVPRPRVMESLGDALNHSLTLVSAPPGFGKSTAVSQWVRLNGEQTRSA
jgi:LuxR family maltose regulon positive regulatory protein